MARGRTTIPAITIGVPVYNHAGPLAHALEGLAAQTFADFTVLIYDNASTDETGEVARAFAAADPRFVYVRQPHNKGALRNFYEVLKAAKSPYFMWRAADDFSDDRFVEVLIGRLAAEPDKTLAVGRILNAYDGQIVGEARLPPLRGDRSVADRWSLFHKVNASYFYGVFRREPLTQAMDAVMAGYGEHPWAFDYLTLLPFLLDGTVALTDQTWFAASARRPPRAKGEARTRFDEPDLDLMLGLRRRFRTVGRTFTRPRFPGPFGGLFGEALLWRFANMRVYKFRRLARAVIRRRLGLTQRRTVGAESGWLG